MKRHLILTVAIVGVALSALRPAKHRVCSGFLPENHLKILVGSLEDKGLHQEQFNKVLDRIQAVYGPIVAAHGGSLNIDRRWEDGTVNAMATREGNDWTIHMYGGLARFENMTEDGFSMVACHELGHHLGGAPKGHIIIFKSWASNEGEADYFANLKCARRMFTDAGDVTSMGKSPDYPKVVAACNSAFGKAGAQEKNLCIRSAMAGVSLASILRVVDGGPVPQVDRPDRTVVRRTNDAHPAAQCRLDTYFQGSLCGKAVSEDLDDNDVTRGACTRSQGFQIGMRPFCWYKPPIGQELIARAPLSLRDMSKSSPAFAELERGNVWDGR